ncbi:MAG: UDP-N-acetylglucosamine 2-epimerase (non-hydrolyzing) [Candidatus Eisenbacteria bacterium]|nr:UDP-N-acetylglucosamine 2-epimerase (non-hydrolyzing) [Candidatus Latescibacterota bacterium]MBD3301335.1 UDP-N-acetylglucosamine 2-epimerase (non-hydrolyzing) [Candidatus Eisenbacteria bacterium]
MRTQREVHVSGSLASLPRILCAAGARPNFMKVAPILARLRESRRLAGFLVHTGQHYDAAMSEAFFRDLGIPEPDEHLGVGSHSPPVQTGRIMERFAPILDAVRPACVLVVGDVNSTLACALAAAKVFVPVAHVEAGLRSGDRTMPEELNRILTDAASDLLFTTSPDADANLRREGIPPARIHRVGNVMIDSLRRFLTDAERSRILEEIGVEPGRYALVTLHRPSNVDRREDLDRIVSILEGTAARIPVVFPVHPRSRARLQEESLFDPLRQIPQLHLREPEGYLDFLKLVSKARIVLTDSGGIQEETTVLGVPCLTLRPNTERPITIDEGTNRLVGSDPRRVLEAVEAELERSPARTGRIPDLWDGRAADRIVRILEEIYAR